MVVGGGVYVYINIFDFTLFYLFIFFHTLSPPPPPPLWKYWVGNLAISLLFLRFQNFVVYKDMEYLIYFFYEVLFLPHPYLIPHRFISFSYGYASKYSTIMLGGYFIGSGLILTGFYSFFILKVKIK